MEKLIPEGAPNTTPITQELFMELRKSIYALERRDWNEAKEGIYPESLLFEAPWIEWAPQYPLVWLDLPSTWERRINKKTRDIPE